MTKRYANRTYTNRRYLDAIADHVVIFDGAMGTNIQRYNLTADDFGGEQYNGCNDFLVITRPDVIAEIHASFLAVGSEAVETDTFRSNPLTLKEYGLRIAATRSTTRRRSWRAASATASRRRRASRASSPGAWGRRASCRAATTPI